MVKCIGASKDLVVVDLENQDLAKTVKTYVLLENNVVLPKIVRVSGDHIELDVENINRDNGTIRKKTLKFWIHDLIIMNNTLYRIQHPP
jgi:SPX domain protein involved in polyphosphate accumulation